MEKRKKKADGKLMFLLFAFTIAFVVILGRVCYWKIAHGSEFEDAARNQQINRYDITTTGNRGSILDRNNQILAISTAVYNIALDPLQLAEVSEEEQEKTLSTLCEKYPELDYVTLKGYITVNSQTGEINLPTHWKYLVKEISREEKEALEALDLQGVYFEQTSKRSYPLQALACHVIGFSRGDASWGLENEYNDVMTGTNGRSFIVYSGANSVTYETYAPEDGQSIVTTLDYNIQQIAEEAVEKTATQWPSQNVAAIVMNPNTGEIYAMANSGRYNLNDPSVPLEVEKSETFAQTWENMSSEEQTEYLNNIWKNFCISSTYEPGSIFKPITVAAAYEEGVIDANDTFVCNGHILVEDTDIDCHLTSGHGTLNVEGVMAQSCNPGVVQIAQRLGVEKFYQYFKDFGFGELTGIDLPGEVSANNLIQTEAEVGPVELATMSFGQTFNCTSLQIINAFATLINGGNLMQPYVVSQIVDEDGTVVMENTPKVVRKVISTKTSDYIRTSLKATVEYGTAKKIAVAGYSIGSKTGTAEQGSRARNDLWTLTYMACFPVENPQYLVLTVINLPEDYADGVQSPSAMTKEIIEKIIQYKNLEPSEEVDSSADSGDDENVMMSDYVGSSLYEIIGDLDSKDLTYKVIGTGNTVVNQVPKSGASVQRGSEVILYVEKSESESGTVTVPSVTGMSYDDAVTKLTESGFTVAFEGDKENTVVISQDPKYGLSVEEGSEVMLQMGSAADDTSS